MPLSPVPEVVAVDVIAARATEADGVMVRRLSAGATSPLPEVAYIVRVALKALPAATSQGWALYVGDIRIPKYWTYPHGIWFKVFDPSFFAEHSGKPLRFSQNDTDFVDTGERLSEPAPHASQSARSALPDQKDVLK